MPNWCYNSLEISKKTEDGLKLIEAFESGSPFETLMPTPKELDITAGFATKNKRLQKKYEANKEKYGFAHWYDWRIANWGVKWEACEIDKSDHPDSETVVFRFDTAWCDPSGFFQWVAENLPNAIFVNEYSEEGMGFAGYNANAPTSGYQQASWELNEAPRIDDLMEEIEGVS